MQCNKIAVGHHQDDILVTLLMNLTHQGAFGTMPPKLSMNKFAMEIIRPLCLVSEKELATLAEWRRYKPQDKRCPYESGSSRKEMKELLARLESINPDARHSLWGSMTTGSGAGALSAIPSRFICGYCVRFIIGP